MGRGRVNAKVKNLSSARFLSSRRRGGRERGGRALVQQSGLAVGRVRMRVRRQDTGIGKREEPTGIWDAELLVSKCSNLNIHCVHTTRVVMAGLVGIC